VTENSGDRPFVPIADRRLASEHDDDDDDDGDGNDDDDDDDDSYHVLRPLFLLSSPDGLASASVFIHLPYP